MEAVRKTKVERKNAKSDIPLTDVTLRTEDDVNSPSLSQPSNKTNATSCISHIESEIMEAVQDVCLSKTSRPKEMESEPMTELAELSLNCVPVSELDFTVMDSGTCVASVPRVACSTDMETVTCIENEQPVIPTAPVIGVLEAVVSGVDDSSPMPSPDIASKVIDVSYSTLIPYSNEELYKLYSNKEVEMFPGYETNFLETQHALVHPKLSKLLAEYGHARQRVAASECKKMLADSYKCESSKFDVWIMERSVVTESGECQDGNPVAASVASEVARLSPTKLSSLSDQLLSIKDSANNARVVHGFSADVARQKIKDTLREVCKKCLDTTIGQVMESRVQRLVQDQINAAEVAELRSCITDLFACYRRHFSDHQFAEDLKGWLICMATMLYKFATWEDYMFILCHVLRCPPGITSWMAELIQIPDPCSHVLGNLRNTYVSHTIATLTVILTSIKQRDKFLGKPLDAMNNDSWVMLSMETLDGTDSNGIDILEDDLLKLLDQVPLRSLFMSVFQIQEQPDGTMDIESIERWTEKKLVELFALASFIVGVFQRGLLAYKHQDYKRLAQELGCHITSVLKHVTDILECFRLTHPHKRMCIVTEERVQCEYDALFERAIRALFSAQKQSIWQFLASLPYNNVSQKQLWKLYYILRVPPDEVIPQDLPNNGSGWEAKMKEVGVLEASERLLADATEVEVLSLMATYSSMALNRTSVDHGFIKTVVLDLLRTGFLCEATQDSCSKSARALLANITSQHPSYISVILANLRDNFELAGPRAIYLFHELPLRLWIPTEADIKIVGHWLLDRHSLSSENTLGRKILSNLNYGSSERLFLDASLHRRIALLVVQIVLKFTEVKAGSSGLSIPSFARSPCDLALLQSWAWEVLSKLRLHLLDRDPTMLATALSQSDQMALLVPELYDNAELQLLSRGVLTKQSIACYVAVLLTTWGHSIPDITRKTFSQLEIVVHSSRPIPVISALQHITPLFVKKPEELAACDHFLNLLFELFATDKSYLRLPKNIITPAAPGLTLTRFGDMITRQLTSFKRYKLIDPTPLVRLWLLTLTQLPNWVSMPEVIYLINIVISCAHVHRTAQAAVKEIFRKIIYRKETPKETSGTLSTLMNWFSSASYGSSLMQVPSYPNAPWFAALIIDLEQEETEHLWRCLCFVIKSDFNDTECPNIELAMQKAAKGAGITTVPAVTCLPIYRWAQQALDTQINHPLVPYLWQRFFTLYLSRVMDSAISTDFLPSSVGRKFFDVVYLARIRTQLEATKTYYNRWYTTHSEPYRDEPRDQLEIEQRAEVSKLKYFYKEAGRLVDAYLLWLDEDRLQQADFQACLLPYTYKWDKLKRVFENDTDMWLEYFNFSFLNTSQLEAFARWESATCRFEVATDVPRSNTQQWNSEEHPLTKLVSRLDHYETPKRSALPDITLKQMLKSDDVFHQYHETFQKFLKNAMLPNVDVGQAPGQWTADRAYDYFHLEMTSIVDGAVWVLRNSADAHRMRLAEHTSLDCSLLELLPNLYRNEQLEVVREAVCHSSPETTLFSHPAHVTCAGAAVLRLTVSKAVVDQVVESQIDVNRREYSELLDKLMQPYPTLLAESALTILKFVRYFLGKYPLIKATGNTKNTIVIRRLGIALFYHLVKLYDEDMSLYPPANQTLTAAMERLAKVFIFRDGSQTMRLLETLLYEDRLMGLLSPYFAPSDAPSYKFLEMYKYIVMNVDTCRPEVCFVLLSKFDVQLWLYTFTPSLGERSTLIGYISLALNHAGLNPHEEQVMIQEIFRKHLMVVLQYAFPEHFGEVLNLLLTAMDSQSLSLDVWFDFLNSLMGSRKVYLGMPANKLKDDIRLYATEQKQLTNAELLATAHLLGKHFNKERLLYGLYGIYPKYRVYVEPLTAFAGMIGHCLVVSTLQEDSGSLTHRLCTILWPALQSMYSPWIVPFWLSQLGEQSAAWIEQLTDDRLVVPPWIQVDDPHATKVVAMFIENIRFILDTLPGCSNILHYVWEFYVTFFAHAAIKEHVLSVVHTQFSNLAWHQFCPTMKDMDLMLKVLNQFLPGSHAFLGGIFTEVPWTMWVVNVINDYSAELTTRAHVSLLHLLVKLSNEPAVRQKCKVHAILLNSQKFAWHMVDATSFSQVLDWWVSSSDPRVVLGLGEAYTNPIDTEVWALLQVVAHFTPDAQLFHPTTLHKRMVYMRACMKMLVQTTSKFKALITKNKSTYQTFVRKQLDIIEAVSLSNEFGLESTQTPECALLLKEMLSYVNQSEGNALSSLITDSCVQWLAGRDKNSVVLNGFLKALGTDVTSHVAFGAMLEVSLSSYFKRTVTQVSVPTWMSVTDLLTSPVASCIEDSLIANGQILSLHALIYKGLRSTTDPDNRTHDANLLTRLMEWLKLIKPAELNEAKLPLLWGIALSLIQRQFELNINTDVALRSVRVLIQLLTSLSDDKGAGWGILGAIGIRKQSPVSTKCRLLSRAMAVFLMAQLPEGGGAVQAVRTNPNAPGAIVFQSSPERTVSEMGKLVACGDAVKGLRELESLAANKNYIELKNCISTAVSAIKDSNYNILDSSKVLGILSNEVYSQQFLMVLNKE